MISQKTIQAVFEAAKIEEVVGEVVQLRRRGINWVGLCPFHREKTPSFTVTPNKNIFKCFGCGEGGNAVHFVMKHDNLSYPEAIRHLAKRYHIAIEEDQTNEERREQLQLADSLYVVCDFAQKYFRHQLTETDYGRSVGLGYFKERGLNQATIEKFGLGFANGQADDLSHAALKRGYDLDILQKAGLTSQNRHDFFRNRVMFPIHNVSGKVIGFGGRILTNDKKQPKYINTPETEIYVKNKSLYGIFFARKAISQNDECFLVEGYTDVLALHQAGIENVVASSGTSLTPGQIQLVKRYTANITVLYDGDAAGIRAALRGTDMLLAEDVNVRVVLLPEPEDPDSYLRKVGGAAFKDYIRLNAKDFVLFKTGFLSQETQDDPMKRAELVGEMVATIARVPDVLKRAVYIKDCARVMQLSEELLHQEVNKRLIALLAKEQAPKPEEQSRAGENAQPTEQLPADQAAKQHQALGQDGGDVFQERDMARLLVRFGHLPFQGSETVAEFLLDDAQDYIEEFDHRLYREIIQEYIEALSSGMPVDSDYFVRHPNPEIAHASVELLADRYEYSPNWAKLNIFLNSQKMPEENQIADAISGVLRFKLHKINRLLKANQKRIGELQKTGSVDDLFLALQVQQRILEMRNELAAKLNTVIL